MDTSDVEALNPHQAVNFTSLVYNDCLYLIGGSISKNLYSDKVHALDLKTGIWYDMGEVPQRYRKEMNGIAVGDNVYFWGGKRTDPMWEILSYNLLTGEWKFMDYLKDPVSYPALASNGNLIYIYENGALQVYNVKSNMVNIYRLPLKLERADLFIQQGSYLLLVVFFVKALICFQLNQFIVLTLVPLVQIKVYHLI